MRRGVRAGDNVLNVVHFFCFFFSARNVYYVCVHTTLCARCRRVYRGGVQVKIISPFVVCTYRHPGVRARGESRRNVTGPRGTGLRRADAASDGRAARRRRRHAAVAVATD